MGVPAGTKNAIGNSGGKSLQDRKIAADVRRLALTKMYKLLSIPKTERSDYENEMYKAILIKLAGTVLPRLTEHSGEDGGPIIINSAPEILNKNGITSTTKGDSEGSAPVQSS